MAATVKILWAPPAIDHLKAAFEYLIAKDSGAAERILQRILSAIEFLPQHPHMGRTGRVEGTREIVITGTPFIVAYRIRSQNVEILAVLHAARRWPGSF